MGNDILQNLLTSLKPNLKRKRAQIWGRYYRARFFLGRWVFKHLSLFVAGLLLSAFSLSVVLQPKLQLIFDKSNSIKLETLRSLFQSLGSGLVGAAAIAFALVMFAMQTNVEKMPHGLFKRLSSDMRLLGAYLSSFLLAVFVISLSLVPSSEWIAISILSAFWATILMLWLFVFAYRRALLLINPVSQLSILVQDAIRNLNGWATMADKLSPLLAMESRDGEVTRIKHDLPRYKYFEHNSHWTNGLTRSVSHTISYSRRYSEIGDHEVSSAALMALVSLNQAYIRVKGKTFFNNSPFINNPMSHDSVVTETLEHLRQNIQIGIARGDEQQIEQSLRAMSSLVTVYLSIDYSDEHASHTHAHLAASYLGSAIQSVIPHKMIDVLMLGVRLLRNNGRQILIAEGADKIGTIVDDIGKLAGIGIASEAYRPITVTSVEALASLTIDLLLSKNQDIRFAADQIRNYISILAEMAMATPETQLNAKHHALLEPYYSGRSLGSLQSRLTDLANAVVMADEDDADARRVAVNFSQWADRMYSTERVLFGRAAAAKSSLTFDVIHWVTHVTKLLLAIANSPACDANTANDLRKHALWLVSTLSFVPDDKEIIGYLESYGMTEVVFEASLDSANKNCVDIEAETQKLFQDWIFKSSKYKSGRQILGLGLLGIATLAVIVGKEGGVKIEIEKQLAKADFLSAKCRADAKTLISKFVGSGGDRRSHSKIERCAAKLDLQKLGPVLDEITNIL